MLRRLVSVLTIVPSIFASPAFAQIDTLDALSYFPFQIGNKWQYEEITIIDPPPDTSYRTVTVMGDTVMPNGKAYRVLENDWHYLRIDSSNLKVYQYFPYHGSLPDSEIIFFDMVYPDSGYFTTSLGYQVQVDTGSGNIGHLQGSASYIEYNWFDGVTNDYTLSRGIGISAWWYWELGGTDGKLVAAIVDSIQYGQFVVGIHQPDPVPSQVQLFPNYPNPFNPSTTIDFFLVATVEVQLSIFNSAGQKIKTLVNERKNAGKHEVIWDGTNQDNVRAASGIYFCRLDAGRFIQMRKMLLVR